MILEDVDSSDHLRLTFNMLSHRETTICGLAVLALSALVALAALSGCSGLNESRTMGSVELETLNPNRSTVVGRIDFASGGDGPSIETLERKNWPVVVDSVGFDGTQHMPTYTTGASRPRYVRQTVRQRSGFPTAVSSTQTFAEDEHLMSVVEGVAAPFWAATDLILMIPRMFITPPWKPELSPDSPRARAPRGMSVATDGRASSKIRAEAPLGAKRVPSEDDAPRLNIARPTEAP